MTRKSQLPRLSRAFLTRTHLYPFLAFAGFVLGCGPIHQVRESTLVPVGVPGPPTNFNQRADLYIGDSTMSFLDKPATNPDANAGLYIPRTQLDSALGIRFTRFFGARFLYRHLFAAGAVRGSPSTVANPGRDGHEIGVGFGFHIAPSDSRFALDLGLDTSVAVLPTRLESNECLDDECMMLGPTRIGGSTEDVMVFSATVFGSYRLGDEARLIAGLGIQNHPSNEGSYSSIYVEPRVTMGPINVILVVGAELPLTDWLNVIPQIQWPATSDPVLYGPIMSVGFRASFGDRLAHDFADSKKQDAPSLTDKP